MAILLEERPPYVYFEKRAVEGRRELNGKPSWIDKDFVHVVPHGSKDDLEFDAQMWLDQKREEVRRGRYNPKWLDHQESAYERWKKGQEVPEFGTPLKMWPALTPAQLKLVQQVGFRTVEDIAQANEEGIRRMGMGGRALKDKATAWLKSAEDHGKVAEELTVLKRQNEDKDRKIADLEKAIAELASRVEEKRGPGRPRKEVD